MIHNLNALVLLYEVFLRSIFDLGGAMIGEKPQ